MHIIRGSAIYCDAALIMGRDLGQRCLIYDINLRFADYVRHGFTYSPGR